MNSDILEKVNQQAEAAGLNRSLTPEFFQNVDKEGFHIATPVLVHEKSLLRIEVLAKMNGKTEPERVYLDMDRELYSKLPDTEEWAEAPDFQNWPSLSGSGNSGGN